VDCPRTTAHTGTLMGIPPTGEKVSINVIDIVRVRNGRYYEHWGVNTLPSLMTQLAEERLILPR